MKSVSDIISTTYEHFAKPTGHRSVATPSSIAPPWLKLDAEHMLSDLGLRECSLAARGIFLTILCLAHKGQPYGHLARANVRLSPEQIAAAAGCRRTDVAKHLPALVRSGVLAQLDSGMIYSPYLLAQAEATANARARGRLGGNPNLKRPHKGEVIK